MTKLLADLEHLDGAVQLLGQPRKPPSRMSNYGAPVQITRTLLTILRKSGQPMTVQELTAALMRELGLAQADARRVRSMTMRVRAALGAQLRQEVLVREPGKVGRGPVWRITQ